MFALIQGKQNNFLILCNSTKKAIIKRPTSEQLKSLWNRNQTEYMHNVFITMKFLELGFTIVSECFIVLIAEIAYIFFLGMRFLSQDLQL